MYIRYSATLFSPPLFFVLCVPGTHPSAHLIIDAYCTGYCLLIVIPLVVLPLLLLFNLHANNRCAALLRSSLFVCTLHFYGLPFVV